VEENSQQWLDMHLQENLWPAFVARKEENTFPKLNHG
jgi:hypothetical protein